MQVEKFYTMKETAKLLSVSVPTIRKMVKVGQLTPITFASRKRFAESNIKKFLNDKGL